MRSGRVFKRCGKCGKRVAERRCDKCGRDSLSWTYRVDVQGKGEPRKHESKGGFRTSAEAKVALNDLLHSVQHDQYVAPEKLTVADFLRDHWLPAKRSNLKPTTLRSYESQIERHVAPQIGPLLLQHVDGGRLNKLYATLSESGGTDGATLSPASVRRVHAMLSSAFADAVRWRKLTTNPAVAADPPKLGAQGVEEMAAWTPEEARAFLASVQHERLYALWRVYLATGMRRGEALALRRQDLDLERATLTVARGLVTVGYVPQFSTPKNGKKRTVDLDAETVAILRAHLKAQAAERLAFGLGKASRDGLLFTTEAGEMIHPDRVSKLWDALVKRSGLRRIRLHDTRHTHVAIAIDAGADPKTIQVRVGHHSVAFTLDRYGHLFPARQREVATAVGRALGGGDA